LGTFWKLDPNDDVRGVVEDLDLESFGKGKRWDASENLRTLHDSICDEAGIQYHEETTENHERVLDIFIRTNDGGTPLIDILPALKREDSHGTVPLGWDIVVYDVTCS